MAVIEIGVISNGVPIYINTFSHTSGNKTNAILKSALLFAIQSTISLVYGEESREIKFKKYSVLIDFMDDNKEVIIYAVANKDSKTIYPIKAKLRELSNNVYVLFNKNKLNQFDLKNNYSYLDPIISDLFSDLKKSSLDRVKELL